MNRYNLRLFDDNNTGAAQAQTPAAPQAAAPAADTKAPQGGSYNFAQVEEFASARAARAEKAALASYFKQQGLSEDQATDAIKAYKIAQEAKTPKIDDVIKERDEAKAELNRIKNEGSLLKKGVKAEYSGYVMYEISQIMAADDKIKFDDAVDKFIKENPQFAKAGASAYRVKTEPEKKGDGNSNSPKDKHAAVNAAIRNAVRRK